MGAFAIIAFALYPFLWIPALLTGNLDIGGIPEYLKMMPEVLGFWGDLFKLTFDSIF